MNLKNCPFCGEKEELESKSISFGTYFIVCSGCHAQGSFGGDKINAIAMWNNRHNERNMAEEFPYAGLSK